MSSLLIVAIVITSTMLLAGVGVLWQQQGLGLPYVEGEQLARHRNVLTGAAPSPWRYRVLAEWVAEGFVQAAQMLHVPRPVATGFLGLRIVQNILIFVLTFAYYRQLGIDRHQALVGVMVLAFVFTHALDNSDLSFNTYFDVMFYLLAALAVLSHRTRSFLLVVIAAALNRETSGLMPVLPVAAWAANPHAWPADWLRRVRLSGLAVVVWLAVFLGLRVCIGVPSQTWEEQWGFVQGLPLALMNMSSRRTLMYLALTFSILPILTVWNFSLLPAFIKGLFWLMVPLWVAVHVSMVPVNETRLFLVPIALVFIPGALYYRRPSALTGPRPALGGGG